MSKLSRITGKVFGASATASGDDPEIGQFGSALAGTYNGTTDVATIQSLSAWQNGFIGCVTPNTQFPPLPEMTGFGKVLSHQICYLLQQGVAEWDSGTTYYINGWCSYNGSLYISKADENINNLPTNTTYWDKFTGGFSRNYGEIVTSSLPLTDNTLHLADGSLLSATNYPEFVSYVANLYNSLPSGEFSQATQKLTGSNWSKIAYGNGLFVAVKSGTSAVSSDGNTWTEYTVTDLANATDITFDGTNFIALTNQYILTSPDGENWTTVSQGFGGTEKYITYGNSLYVVTSDAGYVYYTSSLTGTWIDAGSSGISTADGLNFGDGKFIIVSYWGEIAYSTNATNWSTQTISQALGWSDIVFDNEKFIAIGSSGLIVESVGNDIQNWNQQTQISNLGNNDWTSLAYGNSKTIALSSTGYISVNEKPFTYVFTSEADWQATYTTYGECGKYVYNPGANTVRIPLYNSYFTNTVDPQNLGNLTPASIPNIKGVISANERLYKSGTSVSDYGAFNNYAQNVVSGQSDNTNFDNDLWNFDASRVSSVYSDSATTVNTQSIKQLVYIVVGK